MKGEGQLKKSVVIPALGLGALTAVGLGFVLKNNRNDKYENGTISHSLANAGIPDQMEREDESQIENAKMVSEGSQFGVQYFNEMSEEGYAKWQEKNQ